MNLDSIRTDLEGYLSTKNIKVFEITYHKSEQTLSILLDEKMDMEQIEEISNDLSTYLDKYESEFDDNYILDVSTVGAERPIRNEEELKSAIGSYIFVKMKDDEYNGTLKDYTDGIIHIEIMDKTKVKNISLDYSKAKKVRYAVRF